MVGTGKDDASDTFEPRIVHEALVLTVLLGRTWTAPIFSGHGVRVGIAAGLRDIAGD